MEPDIRGDRRKVDRRQDQRRHHQRRELPRIIYPPDAAPKVLNGGFRVVNISSGGIMFTCRNDLDENSVSVGPGSPIALKIQFHDQEVVDIEVRIFRCRYDPDSRETVYAGIIENGLSSERINKEQAYLLNSFGELYQAPSVVNREL